MRCNMVTQEQLKSALSYNPETGVFTRIKGRRGVGDEAGYIAHVSQSKLPYRVIRVNSIKFYAHRLAFLYMTGSLPTKNVDHINGDGTDNRWVNLRDVGQLENSKNCKTRKDSKTGVNGIHNYNGGRYRVRLMCGGKHRCLGIYDDFFEACCVRKSAEIKHGYHVNHGR